MIVINFINMQRLAGAGEGEHVPDVDSVWLILPRGDATKQLIEPIHSRLPERQPQISGSLSNRLKDAWRVTVAFDGLSAAREMRMSGATEDGFGDCLVVAAELEDILPDIGSDVAMAWKSKR